MNEEFKKLARSAREKKILASFAGQRNRSQPPVNSVLTPSAQTNGLFSGRLKIQMAGKFSQTIAPGNKSLPDYVKAIIELMGYHGLRVSEALNITALDIKPGGRIMVKGLKKSASRLIHSPTYSELFEDIRVNGKEIPEYYNRFYFYRLFRKLGFMTTFKKSQHVTVTHVLRYYFISEFLANGGTVNDLQNVLGHKSLESTQYYVNNLLSSK